MTIDFKSDLLAVQANSGDLDLCANVLDKIASWSVTESSDDKETVANLFYETLKAIQSTENNSIIETFYMKTFSAFDNINLIAKDTKNSSSLIIIDFLNDLYQQRDHSSSKIQLTQDDLLVLLRDLEHIKYIFKICDGDGNRYFPVNKLLSNIILDPSFINTKIEPYHVNLIQLAVEMYKATSEDATSLFNKLIDTYNLKFIKYLDGSCIRVDTMDMCNFVNNQVMVFFDIKNNKVLIRHEIESYFSGPICDFTVCHEHNANGRPIGYFVELDVQGTAIDYSEAIKESPKEFLRLLYDENCKNVLIEKMILKTVEGKFKPLNPFCMNDKWVIKGHINGRNGKVCLPNKVIDCIEEGRLQLFSASDRHSVLDQISLGLCMTLLDNSQVAIDDLFDELDEDDWIQNIIIKNWAKKTEDVPQAIEYALTKYKNDLDYCDKDKNIESVEFEKERIRDSLPYSLSLKWIYDELKMPDTPSIFLGTINEREDDLFDIDFTPVANRTLARDYVSIKNTTSLDVTLPAETVFEDFYVDRQNRYFIYGDGVWSSSSDLQNLYKLISLVELNNYRMLSYEMSNLVNQNVFREIKSIVMLHQKELTDIPIKKVDLESLIKIRFVNNLVLNKIVSSTWPNYYNLFSKQQILSFSDIANDDSFSTSEEGMLVVPKDRFQEDAVLRKVYETYIRKNAERDLDWWYSESELTEDKGEYYLNGIKINKIRFLFDNTERGTATIRALAAYLGKTNEWVQFEFERSGKNVEQLRKEIENQKRKCQQYKCNQSLVELADILSHNNPDVETCSYYGTKEGDKTINDFLEYCGINSSKVSVKHSNEITNKAEIVKDDCEKLGLDYKDIYVVIREFNMTKRSLLPLGAVGNANKIVTLLVKKQEI